MVAIPNLLGAMKSFSSLSATQAVECGGAFRVCIIFSKPAGEGFQESLPSSSV